MNLLEKYIIARWCYAIGEDYIDDIEYGYLDTKMKTDFSDNEYVKRSWSDDPCPIELLKKYNLMKYYRDIKFAYKSESIQSINDMTEFERRFRTLNEESRLSYKADGFNIQVNYYNGEPVSAETRGRTGNSLNANVVTQIVPKKIPYMGKVKITGECIIPNDKWKLFQLDYSNVSQRGSVRTCLAEELTQYLAYVAFNIQSEDEEIKEDHYAVLAKCGFLTPMCLKVSTYEQLETAISILGKRRAFYNVPTDGLVIENSKYQLAIRVGEWQEKILMSYITGYTENVGMHQNPMLVTIVPTESSEGSMYSVVSVTNIQYILNNDLQIGSPIAFDLRSMAAPVLNTVRTEELHKEYAGRYDKYRQMIDGRK